MGHRRLTADAVNQPEEARGQNVPQRRWQKHRMRQTTCNMQQTTAADNSRPQAYNFTLGRSNVQQSVHNRQDETGSRSGTRRGGCSRQRWSTSLRRICLPVRHRPCPTCNSHCTTCNRRRVFRRASCATRHTMCIDEIKARMRSRNGMALQRSRRCNVDA